jgi:hypothetical protein
MDSVWQSCTYELTLADQSTGWISGRWAEGLWRRHLAFLTHQPLNVRADTRRRTGTIWSETSVFEAMAIQARDGANRAELRGVAAAAVAPWPAGNLNGPK